MSPKARAAPTFSLAPAYARVERYERGQSIRLVALPDIRFAVADVLSTQAQRVHRENACAGRGKWLVAPSRLITSLRSVVAGDYWSVDSRSR